MALYYNIEEIKAALEVAERNHSFINRFALPHKTHEGKTVHAVKIADGTGPGRIGVYFVGGIHACEWVNPDVLVNFIEVMADAYKNNKGVKIGRNNFSRKQIELILTRLDVFVLPLANPDGRDYSQQHHGSNLPDHHLGDPIFFRKNGWRNANGDLVGVDVNRNFDFLWEIKKHFHPNVNIASSTLESSYNFIGTGVNSEPETKNIISVVDDNPNISFFIDIHSYTRVIGYDWGNDEAQTTNIDMNFRNATYDLRRGIKGDTDYKEYVNPRDTILRNTLANSMGEAIEKAHGNVYRSGRLVDVIKYRTSGTSLEYMASRSYVNPLLNKIHSFTIESGTEFHPEEEERDKIIDEITAALIQFCLDILALPSDIYLRDNLSDTGEEPLIGGGLSQSPDINHFRQQLANPQGTLGNQIAKERGDLFEAIEIGQPNYIYARLQNRGFQTDNAKVDIYWTPPSSLPRPNSWKLIGTIEADNILPGELRVAGPLEWNSVPKKGHYCFVGVMETDTEPKPDKNAVRTIDDFYSLIRESNNVSWKNFDVDDIFIGGKSLFHFWVQGWMRKAIESELVVDLSKLPGGVSAELKILKRVVATSDLENMNKTRETRYHSFLKVKPGAISRIKTMKLKSSDNIQTTLKITLPESIAHGSYDLAVIQYVEGKEMGRVTKRLNVGEFPFVGNRKTKEIHKKNCPWVVRMSPLNKVAYGELELGLKHGYDGCYTCLNEFDNG